MGTWPSMDDEELLGAAAVDRAAFGEFYERHERRPRPRRAGLQHHGRTLQGGRPCRGLEVFRGPLTARPS
jgi:hypothetical protein